VTISNQATSEDASPKPAPAIKLRKVPNPLLPLSCRSTNS
jgi:hypothetical protein